MLFALRQLRNISLPSLGAECQDSVCKQSGHVRVLTWRKLLSHCPRCLTPEVNPDIDTLQGEQHSLQPRATHTEPYHTHSVITLQPDSPRTASWKKKATGHVRDSQSVS
ncbi:hypothetical protein NQZ68_006183 [Dissostichus eleginoides]|nr:hypothetical protein NQZ68_006183 [Dissostichus eleginoides]